MVFLTQMYIHKRVHTQVEEIYTYNDNNVNQCLAKMFLLKFKCLVSYFYATFQVYSTCLFTSFQVHVGA